MLSNFITDNNYETYYVWFILFIFISNCRILVNEYQHLFQKFCSWTFWNKIMTTAKPWWSHFTTFDNSSDWILLLNNFYWQSTTSIFQCPFSSRQLHFSNQTDIWFVMSLNQTSNNIISNKWNKTVWNRCWFFTIIINRDDC